MGTEGGEAAYLSLRASPAYKNWLPPAVPIRCARSTAGRLDLAGIVTALVTVVSAEDAGGVAATPAEPMSTTVAATPPGQPPVITSTCSVPATVPRSGR